jgi:hypothetical protein
LPPVYEHCMTFSLSNAGIYPFGRGWRWSALVCGALFRSARSCANLLRRSASLREFVVQRARLELKKYLNYAAFDVLGLRASRQCIRELHNSMALQGKWVHRSSWLHVLSRRASMTPEWFRLSGLSNTREGREIERLGESKASTPNGPESRNRGGGRFIQNKATNEVDAGRNRATPASVRHDDDEPLTPRTKKVRVQHDRTSADWSSTGHSSVKPLAYEASRVRLSVDDYR